MGFVEAVKTVLSKYATFSGRATRPEYWYFVLFYILCKLGCDLVDFALGTYFASGQGSGIFSALLGLALVVPHFAVTLRRLHDTERSGWWAGGLLLAWFVAGITIAFMPKLGAVLVVFAGVGSLALLVWLCSAGTPGPNQYGPSPPTAVIPALTDQE